MNEVQTFTELRPSDVEFTDEDRAAIAQAVFGHEPAQESVGDDVFVLDVAGEDVTNPQAGGAGSSRYSSMVVDEAVTSLGRRAWLLRSAAAVAVFGLGAALVSVMGGAIESVIQAATGDDSDSYEPPLIIVDAPGWSTLSTGERHNPFLYGMLLVEELEGLDRGAVMARVSRYESSVVDIPGEPIEIDGRSGKLQTEGELTTITLDLEGPNQVDIAGWKVETQRMLSLAAALNLSDDGGLELTEPVDGLVEPDRVLAEVWGHVKSYSFINDYDPTNPRPVGSKPEVLTVSLLPGGPLIEAIMVADSRRVEEVMFNGETIVLGGSGSDEHRFLTAHRGFWLWWVHGEGFDSEDHMLDVFADLTVVGEEQWQRSFGDTVYGADELIPAARSMLEGTPVPDGFTVDELLEVDHPVTRFGMAEIIANGVTCAWIASWLDAEDRGDDNTQQQAIDALSASADWASTRQLKSIRRIDERDLTMADFALQSMRFYQVETLRSGVNTDYNCDR